MSEAWNMSGRSRMALEVGHEVAEGESEREWMESRDVEEARDGVKEPGAICDGHDGNHSNFANLDRHHPCYESGR